MSLLTVVACFAVSYLLGNIQTGILVGKLLNNIDLRAHGSGSSGATNALRILGRQSALLTLAGDCLKGVVAVCFGLWAGNESGGMLSAVSVVIGHIWPVFFGFKGGKGVAASIGVTLCLTPVYALIVIAVGVVVFFLTKTVSLASILAIVLYALLMLIQTIATGSILPFAFGVAMALLVLYAHRENIHRLRSGTENRITKEMFEKK